jgi:DNA polymerase-1
VIKPTSISGQNRWVVPVIHPATIIPPKNVYLNKILLQYDLKKAKDIYRDGYHPIKRDLRIRPTYYEATLFLESVFRQGESGDTIDFDIEIYAHQLSCISFALSPVLAMSIPFIDDKGDYFSIQQELDIMRMITSILENPKIRKRGQNLVFDSNFLLRRYGIKVVNMDDTMIAQQILMPEFLKGLDFIASIWTDIPYYKAEGKQFMKKGGAFETLWNYNDLDSIVCAEAFPKQYARLEKQGNVPTYERQRKLIEPLTFMMEHGVKIDVEGMTKRYNDMEDEIEEAKQELYKAAGYELNALSPKQLMNYFYTQKNLKPYTKKHKPTTDETAMKRLARRGIKEANHVLKIRRLTKERSTYLNPRKVDNDGRMRCSYNPVGTKFSRLSSSENIFGTGNNLQNQPHHVLQYFVADPGYIIYSLDLAQAENRIVAYVGRVETMIEAFESGKDVHSLTGSLISRLPYQQVIDEDKNNIPCKLGSGDKTWRFWGKKTNHELNYDMSYVTFALQMEIPQNDGKFLVESYHGGYPGVRQGYHKLVRHTLSEGRTLTNLMGRRTLFLDQWGDSLFKEAYSCIPQGTVGDVINERGIEYVYYNQDKFREVILMLQVHDSIVFEIPLHLGWEKHASILLDVKAKLETPLVAHGREFVIPCDIAMGYNLYKVNMKEIKSANCPDNMLQLGRLLEGLDNELRTEGLSTRHKGLGGEGQKTLGYRQGESINNRSA